MFDLSDGRKKRRRTIAGYADADVQLGVILAAVDFEWTCRRAMLALSKNSTVSIYEKFSKQYASFKGLKTGWPIEVIGSKSLDEIFEASKVSMNDISDAMAIRNAVVHGSGSRISRTEGRFAVYVLETACDILAAFVEVEGQDSSIFKRISRRRAKEDMNEQTKSEKRRECLNRRILDAAKKLGMNHWVNAPRNWN